MSDKPVSKTLMAAARLGLPADSEERAADAVLARAELLAEVCKTIGLPPAGGAAEITARVAELATQAARLPKLEAELKAAREVEERRAKAERRAHVDALVEAKPELADARDALEAFAAADFEKFAAKYPRPAGTAREKALTSRVAPAGGAPEAPLVHGTGLVRSHGELAEELAEELAAKHPAKYAGEDGYDRALEDASRQIKRAAKAGAQGVRS